MLELTGPRVTLREFTRENVEDPAYFRWLRDPQVIATINRVEYFLPLQVEDVRKYVERLQTSGRDCFFAVYTRERNEFIGTQRLGNIDWRTGIAEIGVMIGERDAWGKGYATDAVALACDYAFNRLSLRRLIGGTPSSNVAMCRCFSRLGFAEEGRLRQQLLIDGVYQDHVYFGLLKEEHRK